MLAVDAALHSTSLSSWCWWVACVGLCVVMCVVKWFFFRKANSLKNILLYTAYNNLRTQSVNLLSPCQCTIVHNAWQLSIYFLADKCRVFVDCASIEIVVHIKWHFGIRWLFWEYYSHTLSTPFNYHYSSPNFGMCTFADYNFTISQTQFVIAYIFRVNCIEMHSISHVFNTVLLECDLLGHTTEVKKKEAGMWKKEEGEM